MQVQLSSATRPFVQWTSSTFKHDRFHCIAVNKEPIYHYSQTCMSERPTCDHFLMAVVLSDILKYTSERPLLLTDFWWPLDVRSTVLYCWPVLRQAYNINLCLLWSWQTAFCQKSWIWICQLWIHFSRILCHTTKGSSIQKWGGLELKLSGSLTL